MPSAICKLDNESIAFGERDGIERCFGCLNILNKWATPLTGLRLRKRNFDVSTTYDGVAVVSKRFREWLKRHKLVGIELRELPADRTFHQLLATRSVAFDDIRRGVIREDQCPICHRYDSVARGYPVYLKPGEVIGAMEIVRTDLEFGTADEQSPILIAGEEAAELLRQSGLTGFYLEAVNT